MSSNQLAGLDLLLLSDSTAHWSVIDLLVEHEVTQMKRSYDFVLFAGGTASAIGEAFQHHEDPEVDLEEKEQKQAL